MSNQRRRLHRLGNLPAFLRSEVIPYASVEHVAVDGTVTEVRAPRYTVEARGEFWVIVDADGPAHGLPTVYETFTSIVRALECAHTLNTSVWGYRKPVPVPARALETALDQPLRLVAPERHRDVTPDMRDNRCVCGVRVTRHYDGWDGTRLSCDEALRRHGLA
jgi:hypothetical protein